MRADANIFVRTGSGFGPVRFLALAATLLGYASCAPAVAPSAPTASEIAALEARSAAAPNDHDLALRLGTAYQRARRPADAARVLEPLVAARPRESAGVLVLGLSYEDLGRYPQARELYERYLRQSGEGGLGREIRARIPLLQRKELELAIKRAIETETAISTAPSARSVAVFPFLYSGNDPNLRPLSRALADMLTSDLAQTDRLTVLERTSVQLLLDEIALGETGLVDASTAARGGRMLGAARIVQGRIDGNEAALRLQASVVDASTSETVGRRVDQQDALRRLFDLENRIALDIYAAIGVQLTAAELARVNRNPTDNVQAVLAYGRALEASDRGDFAAAAREFAQAARLDRGFAAARQGADRATAMAAAAQTTTEQLGQRAASPVADPNATLAAIQALVPTAAQRDAATEVLGTEGIGKRTTLEIIIRRN